MPGSIEAALVLIVLAGPGFVASRLLNSLVPYRTPTAFQETTQAVVFSAVMVPIWVLFAKPLLASRNEMLVVWKQQQQAAQLPGWAIWMPILIFGLVYFVVAPCVATVWAIFIRRRPHVRLAQTILGLVGVTVRSEEGPEVWDVAGLETGPLVGADWRRQFADPAGRNRHGGEGPECAGRRVPLDRYRLRGPPRRRLPLVGGRVSAPGPAVIDKASVALYCAPTIP